MPTFKVFKGSEDGYPKESTATKLDEPVGDNVLKKCCGHCLLCLQGEEVFCRERSIYGFQNVDEGSFASQSVWNEAFLHVVPDSISDEDAAPLQCGGATAFTALGGAKPTATVAIMGVGGLGHLCIQFTNKLGYRVVVLSGINSKREEALQLGAHKFISMANYKPEDFEDEWRINRLLIATSMGDPVTIVGAVVYALSVSFANLEMPYMPFILDGISVKGPLVATRTVHREMLAFAAFHEIKPVVETFPLTVEDMREAMDKLDSGKVHFKAVLIVK
ncbi:unnamed protein product [Clonostachys rhizophaga]|uniref:Alcohol dehydrogenase n=1 Tax=Clonostachys rhizophaga TaxID=160324 RepID=A0A9N9VLU9_9HYPO|nr:unnamed protein product [Clonostachys rhizophaga]